MNTNTPCNTLKPVRRFKASILTTSLVAVLIMTHADTSEAGNEIGSNTWFGEKAFISHTTGIDNSAFGFHALFSNTTGSGNTATGWNALELNTTGNGSTAYGTFALANNNIGNGNSAFGNNALFLAVEELLITPPLDLMHLQITKVGLSTPPPDLRRSKTPKEVSTPPQDTVHLEIAY